MQQPSLSRIAALASAVLVVASPSSGQSDAVAAFEEQTVWRAAAAADVKPGIEAYLAAIADNVGARQQDRLSREQALYIAGCNAGHRDLSLHF